LSPKPDGDEGREHLPHLPELDHRHAPSGFNGGESAECVQDGHMSAYRLERCLIILGWSAAEFARRSNEHKTTVQRWRNGSGQIDPDVAEWLETLVEFHLAHPCPRRRTLPAFPDQHGRSRGHHDEEHFETAGQTGADEANNLNGSETGVVAESHRATADQWRRSRRGRRARRDA
jgi:transcriptional regulator with XRE-family HTH domain